MLMCSPHQAARGGDGAQQVLGDGGAQQVQGDVAAQQVQGDVAAEAQQVEGAGHAQDMHLHGDDGDQTLHFFVGFNRTKFAAWRSLGEAQDYEYTTQFSKDPEKSEPNDPVIATWGDGFSAEIVDLTCLDLDLKAENE